MMLDCGQIAENSNILGVSGEAKCVCKLDKELKFFWSLSSSAIFYGKPRRKNLVSVVFVSFSKVM